MASSTSETLQNIKVHKVPNFDVWEDQYGQTNGIGTDDIVVIPPTQLDQHMMTLVPAPGTSNPAMDGTASPGASSTKTFSKSDHVHPTDTSRAPTNHASSATTYGVGNSSNYGHLKLSDSTSSTDGTSNGTAATPSAVKAAYDLANGKQDIDPIGTIKQTIRTDLENNWHLCDGSKFNPTTYPEIATILGRSWKCSSRQSPVYTTYPQANPQMLYNGWYWFYDTTNSQHCFTDENFQTVSKIIPYSVITSNIPSGSTGVDSLIGAEIVDDKIFIAYEDQTQNGYYTNYFIIYVFNLSNTTLVSGYPKRILCSADDTEYNSFRYTGNFFYFLDHYRNGNTKWKKVCLWDFNNPDVGNSLTLYDYDTYSFSVVENTLFSVQYYSDSSIYISELTKTGANTYSWSSRASNVAYNYVGSARTFDNDYYYKINNNSIWLVPKTGTISDSNVLSYSIPNNGGISYLIQSAIPSYDGSILQIIAYTSENSSSVTPRQIYKTSFSVADKTFDKLEYLGFSFEPSNQMYPSSFTPRYFPNSRIIYYGSYNIRDYLLPYIQESECKTYIKIAENPTT